LMGISRLQKLFGVGPMGAVISIVWLRLAVWVDQVLGHAEIFANPTPVKVVGVVLAASGLGLLFWTIRTLRNWWAKEELCTIGPFKWFRHPMYAAWITFIVPSIALYFNSWIILLFAILLHPVWHQLVIREEKVMLGKFQNEYRVYAARTGRFFPRLWNR
jgi:protein-S-isoprenylcysteine O-methyltransferase Ste14